MAPAPRREAGRPEPERIALRAKGAKAMTSSRMAITGVDRAATRTSPGSNKALRQIDRRQAGGGGGTLPMTGATQGAARPSATQATARIPMPTNMDAGASLTSSACGLRDGPAKITP